MEEVLNFEINEIKNWDDIAPLYNELVNREITSGDQLKKWLSDVSDLEGSISEQFGWAYIKMTCDTQDEEAQKNYMFLVSEIQPEIAPFSDQLNKKLFNSEFKASLNSQKELLLLAKVENSLKIFREENISISTENQKLAQEFSQISGAMTLEYKGNQYTLQQANEFLKSIDRSEREEVYKLIQERRYKDHQQLDRVFNDLVKNRDQIAKNAEISNFRDYMFVSLNRFDYNAKDSFEFHDSIQKAVVPLLDGIKQERKSALGLSTLKPWDLAVDKNSKEGLKPFESGEELLEKGIAVFNAIDPFLGNCLKEMKEINHFDLDSRIGKAPGGYNYPLYKTGYPFIFMNASSSLRDMVTLMHEGGHAVHSIVTKDLPLTEYKQLPSEVAELASMSMELISMDYWDIYFSDPEDLKRAKLEHLEGIIETLPWVATIDKFQHWIYENPEHTIEERNAEWINIFESFSSSVVDWKGLEHLKAKLWQKQLHLFEVPFYYIEYGIAQLGAIAVWKNYMEDKNKGLSQYLEALKLGYTKSIPEIYQTAGVRFDFSEAYIKELFDFLKDQYEIVKG